MNHIGTGFLRQQRDSGCLFFLHELLVDVMGSNKTGRNHGPNLHLDLNVWVCAMHDKFKIC